MQDYHQQDYYEQLFTTAMPYDSFHKLVLRTCKSPYWIAIEGRDRNIVPPVRFISVKFSSVEDRDRVIIAQRLSEAEYAPKPAPRKAASGRLAVA